MTFDDVKEELSTYFTEVNDWKVATIEEITKDVNEYCSRATIRGDIDNYQLIWTPPTSSDRITVTLFRGKETRSFYCVFDYLLIKPLKSLYDDYDRAMGGIG